MSHSTGNINNTITNRTNKNMSRPKNPDNNYSFVDAVTGEPIHTNPKQFNDLMARYGITRDELLASYVGQKSRNQLAAEKLSVAEAIEKYKLHPNVANHLKALRAPVVKTPRVKAVVEAVETPSTEIAVEVPAGSISEETPVTDEVTEIVDAEKEVVSGVFVEA